MKPRRAGLQLSQGRDSLGEYTSAIQSWGPAEGTDVLAESEVRLYHGGLTAVRVYSISASFWRFLGGGGAST